MRETWFFRHALKPVDLYATYRGLKPVLKEHLWLAKRRPGVKTPIASRPIIRGVETPR
jgi:hypothetical protein